MNTRTVYVPTADGTALATDVRLPDGTRPVPAVLIRTPYGREAHRAELRGWAAHGFAALAQDVRGRHGSPGEWHPYRDHEETDGAATVAWVRAQAWSNGEVVAAGASYAAYCALVTALAAPEAACDAGPEADLDDFHRDGATDNLRRDGAPGDLHGDDGVPDAVIAVVPALGLTETAREPGGRSGCGPGPAGGRRTATVATPTRTRWPAPWRTTPGCSNTSRLPASRSGSP